MVGASDRAPSFDTIDTPTRCQPQATRFVAGFA
jgi:hypothetical protein